jgi:hypothetical protein
MLAKHTVRFIHNGKSRTYILMALGTVDAICNALDLLECDVPDIESAIGLAVISKAWPEGAHLAAEGEGPLIDTTREAVARISERETLAA